MDTINQNSYIVQAIFQENTLRMIRGHLKRMSGVTVEEQDLVSGIKNMISADTWQIVGDIKIKRQRKVSRQSPIEEQKIGEPPQETTTLTESEISNIDKSKEGAA